nr:MerR family transcriptional regulator [Bifidobacterium choloepi]
MFDAPVDPEYTRGYRGTVASKIAGITYRQLDYWARKGIVEPSITPSHGSGSRRLYSFKDIVILAVSKQLLDVGVNLQNVTNAIEYLMTKSVAALEHTTIMCDGTRVHDCSKSEQIAALLGSGRAVFGISVGTIFKRVTAELEDEDYTELADGDMAVVHGGGVPSIEEIATARMARKLEHRRLARATVQSTRPRQS